MGSQSVHSRDAGAQGVPSTRAANGGRGCPHGTGRKLTWTRPRPRCVPTLCVTPTCSGSGMPDNAKELRYPMLFHRLIFEDCWLLIATRNKDFIERGALGLTTDKHTASDRGETRAASQEVACSRVYVATVPFFERVVSMCAVKYSTVVTVPSVHSRSA